MTMTARLAAAAIAIAVVVAGGALILRPGSNSGVGAPTSSPTSSALAVTPSSLGSPSAIPSAPPVDYSALHGQILMEHLGNAPDGSEMPTSDYHPERRRLYFMDPATMTGKTARELLPGQPASGKLNADVSADGKQVVFMDTSTQAKIWIANLDGTGLRQLTTSCACSELDPAFDPTGTKIAFVHLEGVTRPATYGANGHLSVDAPPYISWLGIRDLATGKVTKLDKTVGPSTDAVPEQPSWSPDGTQIVFNRTTWGTGDLPASGVLQVVDVTTGAVRTFPSGSKAPIPGDADWSPDGSTIVFTNYPWSSMGSIGGLPDPLIFTVRSDGTNLSELAPGAGASYMPDGRIVFQNNYFWVMNADGTDSRPVNIRGDDLTELNVGFAYIPHWVGMP